MRTQELIKMLPTQYRRISPISGIYCGHNIPLIGTWSKDSGYIKRQSLKDTSINESLACPIIAVVSQKFGNKDVTLTITSKRSTYKYTKETKNGDYTISQKIYEPTETTITSTLTIPRYTRPYATFLITGLGNDVYEISSITNNVDFDVGVIEFYALASNGSKIIYWLGIHNLSEQIRTLLRSWIAPCICNRCKGTGIEPSSGTNAVCEQCKGYKYDGYSAEAFVQRNIGFDVGLAREILDWDNLTDDDHELVKKFINKCWTQKWWVTPTVKEIRRLIKHFYMIEDDDIEIVERLDPQEPVWSLFLPISPDTIAPFGQQTLDDQKLIKYIAESITPAGVSVFVGFYEIIPDSLGYLDFECGEIIFDPFPHIYWFDENNYWGIPRWDFMNGWEHAILDFEPASPGMPPKNGSYKITPDDPLHVEDSFNEYNVKTKGDYYATYSFKTDEVSTDPSGWVVSEGVGCTVQVISDLGDHNKVVELFDNGAGSASITNTFSASQESGTIDLWIRTTDSTKNSYINLDSSTPTNAIQLAIRSGTFKYWNGVGYTDTGIACANNIWYHFRIDFECGAGLYLGLPADYMNWIINDCTTYGNRIAFHTAVANLSRIQIFTESATSPQYTYVDAVGYSWDSDYDIGWNKNAYDLIEETNINNWNYKGVIDGDHNVVNDGHPHNKVLKIEENSDTDYYPATYSFTDELIGTTGTNIDFVDVATATATIVDDYIGHDKIIRMTDSGATYTSITHNLAVPQASGTIEFWVNLNNINKRKFFQLYAGAVNIFIMEFFNDGTFITYDGGAPAIHICNYVSNQWYHVRVDFECGAGGYMGLAADTFDIYVGEELVADNYGMLNGGGDTVTKLIYGVQDNTCYMYLDAIGFSWDDNYIIGDNLIEVGAQIYKDITPEDSRKINFYIKGDLDEYLRIYFMKDNDIAFSIKADNSDLYWIDGDSWIQGSVVNNNWHLLTIDLDCANDKYDLYLDGNLEASSIDFQQSISEINKIFFETKSGLLNYDVYCDCITVDTKFPGDKSTSPLIQSSGYLYSNPHAESYNVNDRFRHMCRLRDNGAYFDILNKNYQLTGTFEYWMHPSSSNMRTSFYDRSDNELFYLEYDVSAKGFVSEGHLIDLMMPDSDKHVRIDFECSQSFCGKYISGSYDVYLNRNLKYSGYFTGIEGIYHNKIWNSCGGTGFFDAVGWTWESGASGVYSIGENYTTLDWIGYGTKNDDCIDTICNILEDYIKREKVIIVK